MKKSIKNFVICGTAAASIGGVWCCADEVRAAEVDLTADENLTLQTEEASLEESQAIEDEEHAVTENEEPQESEAAEEDTSMQDMEVSDVPEELEVNTLTVDVQSSENNNVVVWDDASGRWCVKNGEGVNTNYTGVAQNENGWWYIRDGYLDWDYTGVAQNENGWWYIKNGCLDWSYTGVAQNENGWWYIRDGYLDWNYTGVAQNENGWWYIRDGYLDWNYTGVAQNENGWWYIRDGYLDWNYTGLAQNENGWWYIRDGYLDWSYTGLAQNENGWWYVRNGALDWNYTGVAENENGQWYIRNGALDWGYTGLAQDANGSHYVVNGMVNWSEADPEEAKLREHTEKVYSKVGRDLRACFNWVVNNMTYERYYGHLTPPSGYTRCQWYSMKAFENHKGNCYSYAGAFYYLAKYLGYDAEYVEGQVTKRGGGYTPHGWVEIDGKYICDPEGQAEISPSLNFYMMPKGNALLNYIR
nr:transglutaminase domain-containing protein [uncultured Blautia sp.]